MKRLLYIILFSVVLVSCSKDRRNVERKDMVLTKVQQEYVRNGNDFGFNLLRNMDGVSTDDRLISPLSAQVALVMLVTGASENTADEITTSLGYGKDVEETIGYMSELTSQLKLMDSKTDLSIANALLVNTGSVIHVRPEYKDKLSRLLYCQLFQYDFVTEGEKACGAVNGWASENTSGLINSILSDPSELKPEDIAIVLNALYFRSEWTNPFETKNTKGELFYPEIGESFLIPTMHHWGYFNYFEDNIVKALTMDYGNGAFRFAVFLPTEDSTFREMLEYLTENTFAKIVGATTEQEVLVSLPKFESRTTVDLYDLFRAVGIEEAFTPNADFSGMADTDKGGVVYVSHASQEVSIKVNEYGSEAAAVTQIEVHGITAAEPEIPKVFKADHPFIYCIYERSTGTILILGTFCGSNYSSQAKA